MEELDNTWKNLKRTILTDMILSNDKRDKRKLIIRIFYINVDGHTLHQAQTQILQLMNDYHHDETDLPKDIFEQYYFDDIWIPIRNADSRVEIVDINNFNPENFGLDEIEELIKKLEEIKEKRHEMQKM